LGLFRSYLGLLHQLELERDLRMPRILTPINGIHQSRQKPPRHPRDSRGSAWSRSNGSHESASASIITKHTQSTSSNSSGKTLTPSVRTIVKEDGLARSLRVSVFPTLIPPCEEEEQGHVGRRGPSGDWGYFVDFDSTAEMEF
jgi:hypothetical protein